ncbi:MAG: PQQ-binding-like beta-propeller repeat protein [Alphaproteobacteria bacterium]|nr:PQQ-binding-like beta-propeller repeat protein [Alphaproteobacteria bacterium]
MSKAGKTGRRVRLSVAASILALAALAPARAEEAGELFERACASCHSGAIPNVPTREALEGFSPEAILESLETGKMAAQGEALSAEERRALAEYLSGAPLAETVAADGAGRCGGDRRPDPDGAVPWRGWDNGPDNQAFQSEALAGLTAAEVPRLALKWAFGVPGASSMRSPPTLAGNMLLLGGMDGAVYALDRESGCLFWRTGIGSPVRTAIEIDRLADGRMVGYFGDGRAAAHAIELRTGTVLWSRRLHEHRLAVISGSPKAHAGRVYVPVSSFEVSAAARPDYPCCTFRGAVAALDAATGEPVWRTFTVAGEAKSTGRSRAGTQTYGPAGAPVWATPAIVPELGLLVIGTGQSYTSPATPASDALVALSLADGAPRWIHQATPGDAWNAACARGGGANCPSEDGPDFDFGAAPVIVSVGGRTVVIGGQKSGVVHALDAVDGAVLWKTKIGRGGALGGIHFGVASDGARAFAAVSDRGFGGTQAGGEARPGLVVLDLAEGRELWRFDDPADCPGLRGRCRSIAGFSASPAALPGVVFAGALDGTIRAFDAVSGAVLWSAATQRAFDTVNEVTARGGSIDAGSPVIADGHVYVMSGYQSFNQVAGNVLLAFTVDGR